MHSEKKVMGGDMTPSSSPHVSTPLSRSVLNFTAAEHVSCGSAIIDASCNICTASTGVARQQRKTKKKKKPKSDRTRADGGSFGG